MSSLRQVYRTENMGYRVNNKGLCELQRTDNAIASSRVKGQPTSQPHVKARVCRTASAEQPMNITQFGGDVAALLPHFNLKGV